MENIVVVGGGITGAFTTYLLARNGHNVIMLDEKTSPYKATECNPGGINPHHGPFIPGIMDGFHQFCLTEHLRHKQEIQDISEIDFNFRVIERLFLALSEDEKKSLLSMQEKYDLTKGFEAEWCSKEKVESLDDRITKNNVGGLLTKGNITVNSTLYTEALKCAAEKYGAKLFYGSVVDFTMVKDNITQIITADGEEIACSNVILCAGFWIDKILRKLGRPISIHAVKGQLLTIENEGKPFDFDVTHGLTGIYQYKDNLYWLGGTTENIDPEPGITNEGKTYILDNILKIIPGLTDFKVSFQCAGYRPVSTDKMPVVGKISNFSNIYIGTGGGSKGILHSVGIASVLLKYMEGQPLDEYKFLTPERF